MTREEAIEYWEGLRKTFSSQLEQEENHFGRMHLQTTIDAIDMAISALRQQEPNDWICTLKCTALMDEGMCSHGGLCCLYESQRTIKENQPLTLDELRKMGGEPVYCVEITGREEWLFRRDSGFADMYGEFTSDDFMSWDNYGKLWWCYRQKPEEDKNGV